MNSTNWTPSSPNSTNWTKGSVNSTDYTTFIGILMNNATVQLNSTLYNLQGVASTDDPDNNIPSSTNWS